MAKNDVPHPRSTVWPAAMRRLREDGGMAGEVETVELPDVVAFLLAHVRGEEETCRELLGVLGPDDGVRLLGHVVSVAVLVASEALPGGRAELEAWLLSWLERRRESL